MLAQCTPACDSPSLVSPAGVHWASIGWILPELHDPDGHEVRFYTIQDHTELDPARSREGSEGSVHAHVRRGSAGRYRSPASRGLLVRRARVPAAQGAVRRL